MSVLNSAGVEGLWGEKTVEINFDPKVNFLIGANGSGKTTLLNLIASALGSDYEGLARNPFTSIECRLSSHKEDPDIVVNVQRQADDLPRLSFLYEINMPGAKNQEFELVSSSPRYLLPPSIRRLPKLARAIIDGDLSPLNDLVRIKWLSVHRTPSRQRGDERPTSDSSVDRRLTFLSNQLVRYFSKLATQRERETARFLHQKFDGRSLQCERV